MRSGCTRKDKSDVAINAAAALSNNFLVLNLCIYFYKTFIYIPIHVYMGAYRKLRAWVLSDNHRMLYMSFGVLFELV